jgi:hypothetical protein
MASATGAPPLLALRRSPQSGIKAMTAAWQVIYADVSGSNLAYLFSGATINLAPMQVGDHIDIRVRKRVVSGGALVTIDQFGYDSVQPADYPSVAISSIPDVYGVEIAMRQTAGVLRNIECEFYAAKILGLT